jgi:hypothetical protein
MRRSSLAAVASNLRMEKGVARLILSTFKKQLAKVK